MTGRMYRLHPPDRTGWMLGLDGPQVLTIGMAAVGAAVALSAGAPPALAILMLAAGVVGGMARVGGNPVLAQLPNLLRWIRLHRERSWLATLPLLGDQPQLPPALSGQRILAIDGASYGYPARLSPVAVVDDARSGLVAATFRVAGRQFSLLEPEDQDRFVGFWGDALGGFCRERSPVAQIRWCEWAAPAGIEEHRAWMAAHTDPGDATAAAAVSYEGLISTAGPLATRHETLVTIAVDRRRVPVERRHNRDRTAAAIETLLGETRLFAARLEAAGLTVTGPLAPGEVARALRSRLDPRTAQHIDVRARTLGEAVAVTPANAGPLAASLSWKRWSVDGAHHRAFLVADWPRTEVPAAWLAPLLLATGAVRSICVTHEPVAPSASRRAIARHAAKVETDMAQRAEKGFRVGALHHRTAAAIAERESELVAGYGEVTYAGIVAIAAPTVEQLERDSADLVQTAASVGIDLRPLNGRHDQAVAVTLPLARGLNLRDPR